jgi:hypothetical protein
LLLVFETPVILHPLAVLLNDPHGGPVEFPGGSVNRQPENAPPLTFESAGGSTASVPACDASPVS